MKNLLIILIIILTACSDRSIRQEITGTWQLSDISDTQEGIDQIASILIVEDAKLTTVNISEKEIQFLDFDGNIIEKIDYQRKNDEMILNQKNDFTLHIHKSDDGHLTLNGENFTLKLEKIADQ